MKVHVVLYTSTETGQPEIDSVWAKKLDANKRKKALEKDGNDAEPGLELDTDILIESMEVQ